MKSKIRDYLIERPTLFPWLAVLLMLATVFCFGIGVVGIFEQSEVMMGFLFLMITIPGMIILVVSDFLLRRLFQLRLQPIWVTEIILIAAFCLWYYLTHFYETKFITERNTTLFVMVKDSIEGTDVKRGSLIQFRTIYSVPEDNVIIVKEFLKENEWIRLKAETDNGVKYKQTYPMSYMQKDTVKCDNRAFAIQFFVLESDSMPYLIFGEKQFDSMRTVICKKMKNIQGE